MLEQNTLTAKEFCALHVSVGFVPLDEEQVADALRGSLVTFKYVENGRTLGMGRVVGDGARSTVTVGLMAATGKEPFYDRFGFNVRPNAHQGSGMQRFLTADSPV